MKTWEDLSKYLSSTVTPGKLKIYKISKMITVDFVCFDHDHCLMSILLPRIIPNKKKLHKLIQDNQTVLMIYFSHNKKDIMLSPLNIFDSVSERWAIPSDSIIGTMYQFPLHVGIFYRIIFNQICNKITSTNPMSV